MDEWVDLVYVDNLLSPGCSLLVGRLGGSVCRAVLCYQTTCVLRGNDLYRANNRHQTDQLAGRMAFSLLVPSSTILYLSIAASGNRESSVFLLPGSTLALAALPAADTL